jgi:hypothetical protein
MGGMRMTMPVAVTVGGVRTPAAVVRAVLDRVGARVALRARVRA